MFSRAYCNQPVRLSVLLSIGPCICVSVCVQNSSFCESAGGGIKSHLLTALVFMPPQNECFQGGYTGICLSVHLSVCLYVHVSLRLSAIFEHDHKGNQRGKGMKDCLIMLRSSISILSY